MVNIRLFHHRQKLPGVSRQRLDVAALTLRIKGVECQRGFTRTGQPGDHHQLVARQREINVFQVVGARPTNIDTVHSVLFFYPQIFYPQEGDLCGSLNRSNYWLGECGASLGMTENWRY